MHVMVRILEQLYQHEISEIKLNKYLKALLLYFLSQPHLLPLSPVLALEIINIKCKNQLMQSLCKMLLNFSLVFAQRFLCKHIYLFNTALCSREEHCLKLLSSSSEPLPLVAFSKNRSVKTEKLSVIPPLKGLPTVLTSTLTTHHLTRE